MEQQVWSETSDAEGWPQLHVLAQCCLGGLGRVTGTVSLGLTWRVSCSFKYQGLLSYSCVLSSFFLIIASVGALRSSPSLPVVYVLFLALTDLPSGRVVG